MVKLFRSSAALASLALSMSTINVASAEELCSIAPLSYANAKIEHPDFAFALSTVEKYPIAALYTDRLSAADQATMLERLVTECSQDTRLAIMVYGIPNKDCEAGLSTEGSVSNTADYKKFLYNLTTKVGYRKVMYVVEPDAVGLTANDSCGKASGYLENLKVAIEILSSNPNAELYVDVGYWTLMYEAQRLNVASIMKELTQAGRVKGIALNTSNYRSTKQMAELCTEFQTVVGFTNMTCIIDTSRNYNEPLSTDWCNVMEAGIGHPTTSETNIANVDYLMYLQAPGESDGVCSNGPVNGTIAHTFFDLGFQHLWNQGYFVKELGMNPIVSGSQTPGSIGYQMSPQMISKTGNPMSQTTASTTNSLAAPMAGGASPSLS